METEVEFIAIILLVIVFFIVTVNQIYINFFRLIPNGLFTRFVCGLSLCGYSNTWVRPLIKWEKKERTSGRGYNILNKRKQKKE